MLKPTDKQIADAAREWNDRLDDLWNVRKKTLEPKNELRLRWQEAKRAVREAEAALIRLLEADKEARQ